MAESNVVIQIRAEINQAIGEFKKFQVQAQKTFEGVEKNTSTAAKALTGMGAKMVVLNQAFELAGKAANGLIIAKDAVLNFANAADELGKTSERLGISAQALQELGFAAKLANVDQTSFQNGLQTLTKRISEAGIGIDKSAKAFKELGIGIKDTQGNLLPTDVVLAKLADRFASIPNQADRVRIAMKLFGDEGARMVPLLQQGGTEIARQRELFRSLGGVITDQAIEAADRFNDSLDIMSLATGSVGNQFLNKLLPPITVITEAFTQLLIQNRALSSVLVDQLANIAIKSVVIILNDLVLRIQQVDMAVTFLRKSFLKFKGLLGSDVTQSLAELEAGFKERADSLNQFSASINDTTSAVAKMGAQTKKSSKEATDALKEVGKAQKELSAGAQLGNILGTSEKGGTAVLAGAGGIASGLAQGGAGGALSLVQGGVGALGGLLGPLGAALGGLVNQIVGLLAQGPEKVKETVRSLAQAIPELFRNIVDSFPVLVTEIAKAIPGIAAKIAAQAPFVAIRFMTAIIKEIPNMIKVWIEEMLKLPELFLKEMLDVIGGIGEGAGDFFSGIGDFLGFQEGGTVPDLTPFKNDKGIVKVSGGEEILNKGLSRKLENFLAQGGGGQPMNVTIRIGESELANVLLNLNRQGFRTA